MRSQMPDFIFESRMDAAFLNEKIIVLIAAKRFLFSASVPFARFAELKKIIEDCVTGLTLMKKYDRSDHDDSPGFNNEP